MSKIKDSPCRFHPERPAKFKCEGCNVAICLECMRKVKVGRRASGHSYSYRSGGGHISMNIEAVAQMCVVCALNRQRTDLRIYFRLSIFLTILFSALAILFSFLFFPLFILMIIFLVIAIIFDIILISLLPKSKKHNAEIDNKILEFMKEIGSAVTPDWKNN